MNESVLKLQDRLAVIPDNDAYRLIGYFINRMAGLEYVVDNFLFTFADKFRKLSLPAFDRPYPFKMVEKIDLVSLAYVTVPRLRSCGDADDFININSLTLGLEEVWSARNILVHGKIHFTEITESSFRIRTHQFERVARNRYRHIEFNIGLGAILERLDRACYLEALIREGIRILEGHDVKKEQEEMRRQRAKGRELVRNLKEWGYVIDVQDSWFSNWD